jgi:hypothetical protein
MSGSLVLLNVETYPKGSIEMVQTATTSTAYFGYYYFLSRGAPVAC